MNAPSNLSRTVQLLIDERKAVAGDLDKIDAALAALSFHKRKRRMSLAGRRRIAEAQRARWAKTKRIAKNGKLHQFPRRSAA